MNNEVLKKVTIRGFEDRYQVLHGKDSSADRSGTSKYTWEQVNKARDMYSSANYTPKEISEELGINIHMLRRILKNRTWIEVGYIPPMEVKHGNKKSN